MDSAMRSTAFDMIDDPNDPAWAGHATAEPNRARRRRVVAVVAALVGVVAATAVVLLSRDEDGRAATPSGRATPNVRPSAIVPVPVSPDSDPGGGAAPGAAGTATAATPAHQPASGWAPVQATVPHWSSEWLDGDLAGVAPIVADRLEVVARSLGEPIEVISGWRSTHEQNDLYRRYLAGAGNLAAPPGLSKHEKGLAADVYVDGVALANVDGALEAARSAGLHFPVPGEPWHAELVEG